MKVNGYLIAHGIWDSSDYYDTKDEAIECGNEIKSKLDELNTETDLNEIFKKSIF